MNNSQENIIDNDWVQVNSGNTNEITMADEQTADFFNYSGGEGNVEEQPQTFTEDSGPILMGPPPTEPAGGDDFMMDFAAAPPATDFAAAPPATDFGYAPPVDEQAAPPLDEQEGYIGEVVEAASDEEQDDMFMQPPTDAPPMTWGEEQPILLGGEGDDMPPPIPTEMPPMEPFDQPTPVLIESESHEPSPLAKWNSEWQVILKERKEEENAAKAAQVEQARADLDAFEAERQAKLESRQNRNRSAELAKLEEIAEDLEKDTSWQRVVKLIDLTQDSAEKSAEIKRMRDVLIYLKNNETKAVQLS